jgi:hypothetical protein
MMVSVDKARYREWAKGSTGDDVLNAKVVIVKG